MRIFIRKTIKNTSGFPIDDVTVNCRATVDSTGQIQEVTISGFKGATSNKKFYTDEATRVIKLMPKWVPATKNGKPTTMSVVIPIKFNEYLR